MEARPVRASAARRGGERAGRVYWAVMRMRRAFALLAAGVLLLGGAGGAAQPVEALYRCADAETVEVAALGLGLCDARPTARLAERAEPDNLQTRAGALVVEVADGGVAARAGTEPGDVIYRVAGVDVAGAAEAAAGLAGVGSGSDTQINFLRRGRPYRIKLRR